MNRPILLLFLSLSIAALVPAARAVETSCTTCHADADLFDDDALEILDRFAADVHAEVGLSCHDCHGGNPDLALADDLEAMDEGYAENPYLGNPARADQPAFCGRCHSDPAYMRRFNPAPRVDQEREYWTSQHGEALAAGDGRVAVCTDCHGVHGIARADSPDSSVYPTRVGETCSRCHADPELMAGYTLEDGRPLPVDQHARWRQSVHAEALFDKDDLTAPTCNDCHGNHGAAPPGVEAVAFVCGQCHGRESKLFRASPKHAGFLEHNEFMADAGAEGCAACHESPQAELTNIVSFAECTTCHGNHGTVRPTLAMFAALPDVPCAFCHEATEALAHEVREPEGSRKHYEAERERLLAEAEERNLTTEARFDWLVEKAETLPAHTVAPETPGAPLRPEFAMLYSKFRIGKTYYTYVDPATGDEVRADIVRCRNCHPPSAEEGPVGSRTGDEFIRRMGELAALTARAERVVLAARRGGVETKDALLDIDQAVDAQIGLQVLVHTFSVGEGSDYIAQHEEGLAHAVAALEKGQEALEELDGRRRWLGVTLGVILLALIALGAKIRGISRAAAGAEGA